MRQFFSLSSNVSYHTYYLFSFAISFWQQGDLNLGPRTCCMNSLPLKCMQPLPLAYILFLLIYIYIYIFNFFETGPYHVAMISVDHV